MHFLQNHYDQIIRYDLLNKYGKSNNFSQPVKIEINYINKAVNYKDLFTAMLALQIVTNQRSFFTRSKNSLVTVKIKKGDPIGCKVTLRKKKMTVFMETLIYRVFPKIKYFENLKLKSSKQKSCFDFSLSKLLQFAELEVNYRYFKNLKGINVSISFNSGSWEHVAFMLMSYKFPVEIVR